MNKKIFAKLICLLCIPILLISASGCSLNSFSVEELKTLYPKAFENSLNEELYYWKETVNAADHTSWRTCNVYAEIDKKYERIRDENGELANMKIDVLEEYNKKNVYKALCGKSTGSNGEISYLFENDFDDSGNAVNYRKTVKFSFAVTKDYLEKYKAQNGKSSLFEGAKYATMEFAYDRFASIVIYAEETLGNGISADKEVYKLETVYFGPIVNIPSYDSSEWANA